MNNQNVLAAAPDHFAGVSNMVAPAVQGEPVAMVDADDDGMWADILPNVTVKVGQILYAAPQSAEQQPIRSDLARNAANHLTNWLEMDICECEGRHYCGYNEVKRTRDALLDAAEQKSTACVGCEGAPVSGNSPCAVCGQKSTPDVSALVEALERFIVAWTDCHQQPVHAEEFEILTDICEDSMKLLAAHRKQQEGEA